MRVPLAILMLLFTFYSQLFAAVKQEELDERNARLSAHLQSFAYWVDDVCDLTQQQQRQLNERIDQAIAQSQQAYQFPEFPNQIKTGQRRLYDYSPIQFVGIRGAAWGVFQAELNNELQKILNKTQEEKYRAAIEKRKQLLHDRFLDHVIITADQELFLTDQQKAAIRNLFPEKLPLLDSGRYWFTPWPGYLTDKPITTLLDANRLTLTRSQTERIQQLQNPSNRFIQFKTLEGRTAWSKQLKKNVEAQRKKLQSIVQVRIDCLARRYQLSTEKKKYLELASKGVIAKAIASWKKKISEKFDLWEKQVTEMLNRKKEVFAYAAVSALHDREIFRHPLWENAVRRAITERSYLQQKQQIQNATTRYAAALLDQELWLTAGQRKQLDNICQRLCLVDKSRYYEQSHFGNQYDLSILGTVLYDCDQKEFKGILKSPQQLVISLLKRQLTRHEKNEVTSFAIKTPQGTTVLRSINCRGEQ